MPIVRADSLLVYPLWAGDFSGEVNLSECHSSGKLWVKKRDWAEVAVINQKRFRHASYHQAQGRISFSSGAEGSYSSTGSRIILEGKTTEFRAAITFGFMYRHCHCGKICISIPAVAPILISIPVFRTNETRASIPAYGVTLSLSFTGSMPLEAEVGKGGQLFFQGDVPRLAASFSSGLQEELFISMCLWVWLQNQADRLDHAL